MSSLTMLEKRKIETLYGMSSGYVLDFTDATFSDFFRTTCKININDEKYKVSGSSKAKRLRAFWDRETDVTVGKALKEMNEIWKHIQSPNGPPISSQQIQDCESIVRRLLGEKKNSEEYTEKDFLRVQFEKVSISALELEQPLVPILELRIKEAFQCREAKSHLSTIFMSGSILEGILLGLATKYPKDFNQTSSAPKTDGKPKQFHDWKLSELIDTSHELGFLSLDVKKFSHALRDFRNYIHPYAQVASGFSPDENTADICLQVLRAAIAALAKSKFSKKQYTKL